MARSRLSRRMEQKTKKNLLLNVLGIILAMLLIFKFGIPLLINLSTFLSGSKGSLGQSESKDPSFVAPPILNSFPQATSSARITISGVASKDQKISLYINSNLIDQTKTAEDGSFSFEPTLKSGENTIRAKAIAENKESGFSEPLSIIFKSAPPSLNVNGPADGQSFGKDQNIADVHGTTDPDVKITVNGFWAITDSDGSFSYRLPLQNGENKIKVTATDIAGNKTEKEIKVTFSE